MFPTRVGMKQMMSTDWFVVMSASEAGELIFVFRSTFYPCFRSCNLCGWYHLPAGALQEASKYPKHRVVLVAALLERVAWRHSENKDQSGRARSQFKTYEDC
jgi:hypothetical protein